MKVNLGFTFDEKTRRRVRAFHGRGGQATRAEIRVWIDRILRSEIEGLPEPRTRGRKGSTVQPDLSGTASDAAHGKGYGLEKLSRLDAAAQAPDDAVCTHYGRQKHEHGKMGYACPPVTSKPRGLTFVARQEVA